MLDPIFEHLLPDYIQRRKQDVSDMQTAFNEKDYLKIKKVCHMIRGSAKTFGFPGLQNICQDLENAAGEANNADCEILLNKIANIENWSDSVI